jgi:hypothetical protein
MFEQPSQDPSAADAKKRLKEIYHELMRRKVVIRQRFGGEALAMPLLFALIIAVFALKFVVIGALILVVVGYRISVEQR